MYGNGSIPSLLCGGQITVSKVTESCPLAIPNQTSAISMHIPSMEKIHSYCLMLSSGNENMEGLLLDRWTDDQCEILLPRQYHVAGCKNPLFGYTVHA